jgi:hypothetical protein
LNVEGIDDGLLDESEDEKNSSLPEIPAKRDREEITPKPGEINFNLKEKS